MVILRGTLEIRRDVLEKNK